MQIPLQITIRDMAHSEALESAIRDKAAKLEQFNSRIMSCHVTAEQPHKHKTRGNPFTVRIDLKVPGKEIVVNRDHDEDIYVALRDAFDVARRQIEDHARRQQP